jgi:hypothetical protein
MQKSDIARRAPHAGILGITLAGMLALTLAGSGVARGGGSAPAPGAAAAHTYIPHITQTFQDVPISDTFAVNIGSLAAAGIIGGYACGGSNPQTGAAEPCVGPDNLPYYRPGNTVTRAQMSKFVDLARQKPGIAVTNAAGDGRYPLQSVNNTNGGVGISGITNAIGDGTNINTVSAGVYARSTNTNFITLESYGLAATADHSSGAWITSGSGGSYYALLVTSGGIRNVGDVSISGNLTVGGSKSGYVVDIMRNTGTTDLHPGEVVAASGVDAGPPVLGEIPVAGITSASGLYNPSVLGVADQLWIPGDPTARQNTVARTGHYDAQVTVIHPGEYVGVVTLGAYKAVKVDPGTGPIKAGDLLTTGGATGTATLVTDKVAAIGAIIGKALGPVDPKTGTVPLLVTLR